MSSGKGRCPLFRFDWTLKFAILIQVVGIHLSVQVWYLVKQMSALKVEAGPQYSATQTLSLAATGRTARVVGASAPRDFAEQTTATAARLGGGSSLLGGLLLGGLKGGPVDEPQEAGLGDQDDEDDDEGGEEVGLVVEDGDGLVGGADFLEPVELTHFVD